MHDFVDTGSQRNAQGASISEVAEKRSPDPVVGILLVMTGVTGVVDAVSFLALGHVFTANMTGNVILLGFASAGAPGLSVSRSVLALVCFFLGSIGGGRISASQAPRAFAAEAILLCVAALIALRVAGPSDLMPETLFGVIAITGVAMGIRNAIVRKLAIPDLTTTVLTLTVTGLAADSTLAGGENPRWQRRCASVAAMLAGAATGTALLHHSAALALGVASTITAACALVASASHRKDNKL